MKLERLSGVAAIALVAMTGAASATSFTGMGNAALCSTCVIDVYGTTTTLTLPTNLPFTPLNLGSSSSTTNAELGTGTINDPGAGISTIMFSGGIATSNSSYTSGLYAGNILNVASSPFGGAQDGSANPNPNQDYLVDQPGGTVTITYSSAQSSLSLLWGTVDQGTEQNLLGLELNIGNLTITGQDIANAIPAADFTNARLEVGVVISNLPGTGTFTTVTAMNDANSAFEFVPGPAPLIGHGLLAFLAVGGILFGGKLLENMKKRNLHVA